MLAASAAAGVAGCGGSSSPHVASLGKQRHQPGSTTTLPKGNPTQLLDEWATCMRANGVPDLADPTIDADGVIHITMPADASGRRGAVDRPAGGGGGPCGSYLHGRLDRLAGRSSRCRSPTRPSC